MTLKTFNELSDPSINFGWPTCPPDTEVTEDELWDLANWGDPLANKIVRLIARLEYKDSLVDPQSGTIYID